MTTMKAWACRLRGFKEYTIVHAPTASKARYLFLLEIRDAYDDATFADISARRAKGNDIHFPDASLIPACLSNEAKDRMIHAFGGGSHVKPNRWGHRSHFYCASEDPEMIGLVGLGIFEKREWLERGSACFVLTKAGKDITMALIGEREKSEGNAK